jgi:hypothetical protein
MRLVRWVAAQESNGEGKNGMLGDVRNRIIDVVLTKKLKSRI